MNTNGFGENPQNINRNGRPKKSFSLLNEKLKEEGYEPLSRSQLVEAYSLLFSVDEAKIQEIADDVSQPLAIRLIIAELTDQSTRGNAIKDMRDYLFGKALQHTDVTSKGETVNIPIINIIKNSNDKEN